MSADLTELHGFEVHPVANLFPLIQGPDFAKLVTDVREHGLIEPVTVDAEGRLIDGRNRVRACHLTGTEVRTREYDGEDVTSFVVSLNMARRHLTDAQRAMIAAEIANLPRGNPAFSQVSANPPDDGIALPTGERVREQMQVSDGSMNRARRVVTRGTPELNNLVKDGAVPLTTASRVAQLPQPEQQHFVEQVEAGARPVDAAPPPPSRQRNTTTAPKAPPKYGGNRRKHLGQLDAMITGLAGYQVMTGEIESSGLDSSVTREEAARLTDSLSTAIRSLNRINTLLKERSK